jgi:putative ABC transport system permease protein
MILPVSSEVADVSWAGLGWSLALIAVVLGLSLLQRLNLHAKLLIGCVRTVVQLLAIGVVLGWVFKVHDWRATALAVTLQLGFAVWSAAGLHERPLPRVRQITLLALLPSYVLVQGILLALVIMPQPWWEPRVVLPIGGMLLGNALTATALALNRYRGEVRSNRELIMVRLALAATWPQAVADEVRAAAYAAMLPSISAMMTVGLVALPGMMTGQILAGADPLHAVRYQIVVMFMIAAVVGLSVMITLHLITRRQRFEAEPTERAPKPSPTR